MTKEDVGGGKVFGIDCDTDACREAERRSRRFEGTGDRFENSGEELVNRRIPVDFLEKQDELVPPRRATVSPLRTEF